MTGDDTAIDAATNRVKDDKSAAEWLPKRNPQTSAGSSPGRGTITTRYHLAVTQDEKDEMIRGLSSGLCDGSQLKPLPPSEFKAPESKPIGEPKPSPKPELQPSPKPTPKPDSEPKEDPEPHYGNCAAVRAAGEDPIHRGDPGLRPPSRPRRRRGRMRVMIVQVALKIK